MTKRVLVERLPKPGKPVSLPEKEADHLLRVLRLREGDRLEALDGHGHAATVTLKIKDGGPRIEFLEMREASAEASEIVPVTLELGILKGDAMEWAVEKAVELGIQRFVPVIAAHSVVQLKSKGPEAFRERWQKIADQALKQCGRLERMEVAQPMPATNLLESAQAASRLWFDETVARSAPALLDWLQANNPSELHLLVGPEGGWSDSERALLQQSSIPRLSLGPWVLRSETAALFSMSLASAQFRSKSLTKIHH